MSTTCTIEQNFGNLESKRWKIKNWIPKAKKCIFESFNLWYTQIFITSGENHTFLPTSVTLLEGCKGWTLNLTKCADFCILEFKTWVLPFPSSKSFILLFLFACYVHWEHQLLLHSWFGLDKGVLMIIQSLLNSFMQCKLSCLISFI